MYYTIGQRKGLGIGGQSKPWYVAGKDIERNELLVVQGQDHSLLFQQQLDLSNASWTVSKPPALGREYGVKIRYRMQDAQGLFCVHQEYSDCFQLSFQSPQWAVTPGQSVVLYDGDHCLGGGIII